MGTQLREWRERRRLSQLELALEAGVSARHVSFVETGRSKPGRSTLLRLTDKLEVPFRERNAILLAAGHAPAFPERALEDPLLEPVRDALDLVIERHAPYPAIVLDRHWNIVSVNSAVLKLLEVLTIDPALLEPPVNAFRITFDPRGLAAGISDLAAWRGFFLERLERQLSVTGDPAIAALRDEVLAYGGGEARRDGTVLGPIRFQVPQLGELACFGMFATFDMPFDVTTSELAVELIFPADSATAQAFEALA